MFSSALIKLSGSKSQAYGVTQQDDHPIQNYAIDLGIKLTLKATVAPAISLDEFMTTDGGQLGPVGIKNAEATTESNNGTLVSLDMTIKYNETANQIIIDQTANINEPWGTLSPGGVARNLKTIADKMVQANCSV